MISGSGFQSCSEPEAWVFLSHSNALALLLIFESTNISATITTGDCCSFQAMKSMIIIQQGSVTYILKIMTPCHAMCRHGGT